MKRNRCTDPTHRRKNGRCQTCHAARNLTYYHERGNARRAEKERLAAEPRKRERRTAARIAESPAASIDARQLYQLEKAKRVAAGKPVLRTIEERRALIPIYLGELV